MLYRPPTFRIAPGPSLLSGAVFAGLGGGASTLKMVDASGFGRDGVLTLLVPSVAWEYNPTIQRFGVRFSALNNSNITLSSAIVLPANNWTCAWWYNDAALASVSPVWDNAAAYASLGFSDSGRILLLDDANAGAYTNAGFGLAGLHHYALVCDANRSVTYWRDGVLFQTKAQAGTGTFTISRLGANGTNESDAWIGDFVARLGPASAAEIQQLADPSNVMLSGAILPPRRKWWGVSGGGGAVSLTVADSESVVESDTVTLTQHHVLVVGDAESVVESEQPAFTQHYAPLVVGDAESLVESDTVSLTQHHILTVADSESIVESEQPALTQHHALTVGDAESLVESDEVTLTYHAAGSLVVEDSESVVESDTVTLTQHHVLVVADAESIVESDEVTLTAHNGVALIVEDSESEVTSDLVVLTQHQLLQVFDTEVVVTSDTVTLGGTYTAVVHYHILEGPSKQLHVLVGPSGAYHVLEGPSKQYHVLKGQK